MKTELEEAAERIISDMGWVWENTESSARIVARHCAKWQQERSCEHNYVLTAQQGYRIIECTKCNHSQTI